MSKPIAAVVFDIEGTLFSDYETPTEAGKGHFGAYIKAVEQLTGKRISFDEIIAQAPDALGGGEIVASRAIAAFCNNEVTFEALRAAKEEIFETFAHETEIHLRPGVRQFLLRLKKANIPIWIASVTSRRKGKLYLRTLGIENLINPNRWVFLEDIRDQHVAHPTKRVAHRLIAEREGVPTRTLLVCEDSISGVTEAVAAGCHVVAFPVFRTSMVLKKLIDAGADRVFGSFLEVNPVGLIKALALGSKT